MPFPTRHRAAALAAVVVTALAGCSTSDDATAHADAGERLAVTPPPVSAAPRLGTVQGLALPTDVYRPTAEELGLVSAAERKLVGDCMAGYGFDWPAPAAERPPGNQLDRMYGVTDPALARRYGYHVPGDGSARHGELRRSGAGRTLSPTEQLVLDGGADGSYRGKAIPAGGCAGAARRQVTGVDDIDPTRAADAITVDMWDRSKSDQRVVDVVAAWSACMRQAGYDYPSPVGVTDPRWSMAGPVTAAEVQAAETDVRCKQSTNLVGVWFTVQSGYERQAVQQRLELLTDTKTRWTGAARTAARLLGRAAPS